MPASRLVLHLFLLLKWLESYTNIAQAATKFVAILLFCRFLFTLFSQLGGNNQLGGLFRISLVDWLCACLTQAW